MPSRSRSRSSAPTPASRSPSVRRAGPCSSRPLAPGSPCTEYAPSQVKQAVCGYGRADKEQVGKMVKAILALRRGAEAEPRGRRARGRDLPRARAAAPAEARRMIARLRGQAVGRTGDGLILDVGGVGYLVHATPRAMRLGEAGGGDDRRDLHARPRGHARALRLRRGGGAGALRPPALVTGIGPRWRSRSSPARRRATCAARSRSTTPRASRPSPGSARRRRSASCSS